MRSGQSSYAHGGGPDPFFGRPGVSVGGGGRKPVMDDLTAQERELILTLRHVRGFTLIVHKNDRWRIVLTDQDAYRTQLGEGAEFASAWDNLHGRRQTDAAADGA